MSDTIALVRVKWVVPADQLEDRNRRLYSRVSVDVLEMLKGSPKLRKLVIGTEHRMDEADFGAYHPEHDYLVFLVKKGDIYQATYGRSGVFELIGTQIQGWPRHGERSFPKPDTAVAYENVKCELSGYLPAGINPSSRPRSPEPSLEPRFRAPNIEVLIRSSDVIALISPRWIRPPGKAGTGPLEAHSLVSAPEVFEVLKGDPDLEEITIATSSASGKGDCACYCPWGRYLVFLVRKGKVYQAVHGRAGVFRLIGYQIQGWPGLNHPSYPCPDTLVDYKIVKAQIALVLQ